MNHLASPYTVSYVVEIGSVNIWKFLSLGTKFTSSQEMKQSSATVIMTLGEQCFHLLLLISLLFQTIFDCPSTYTALYWPAESPHEP